MLIEANEEEKWEEAVERSREKQWLTCRSDLEIEMEDDVYEKSGM
tara:strand:- start:29 stop:163 length:135 start_codon:yes stop_codon:yes gene_type:complete